MRNFTVDGVEIRDSRLADTGGRYVLWRIGRSEGAKFDEARTVWDVALNTIAVAYDGAARRDADLRAFREAAAYDGVDADTQVPLVGGAFEKGGKAFLVLDPSRTSTEITNRYAWKGLVVDPAAFLGAARAGVFTRIGATRKGVLDILDREPHLVAG